MKNPIANSPHAPSTPSSPGDDIPPSTAPVAPTKISSLWKWMLETTQRSPFIQSASSRILVELFLLLGGSASSGGASMGGSSGSSGSGSGGAAGLIRFSLEFAVLCVWSGAFYTHLRRQRFQQRCGTEEQDKSKTAHVQTDETAGTTIAPSKALTAEIAVQTEHEPATAATVSVPLPVKRESLVVVDPKLMQDIQAHLKKSSSPPPAASKCFQEAFIALEQKTKERALSNSSPEPPSSDQSQCVAVVSEMGIPPPPPPPPPFVFSRRSSASSDNGNYTQRPRFKNCPLSSIKPNRNSIFANVKVFSLDHLERISSSSTTLALKASSFSELFGIVNAESTVPRRDSGISECSSSSTEDTSEPLKILDERRSYSLDLMLRQARMPMDNLIDSIVKLNASHFNEGILRDFLKYAPTDSDVALLSTIGPDRKLSPPESFLYRLASVPEYHLRLRCMCFMKGFWERSEDVRVQLGIVSRACQEVMQSSDSLKELITYALSIAVIMNKGRVSWSGEAAESRGFKVGDILKLVDVKQNAAAVTKSCPELDKQHVDKIRKHGSQTSLNSVNSGTSTASSKFGTQKKKPALVKRKMTLFDFLIHSLPVSHRAFHKQWLHVGKACEVKDLCFRSVFKSFREGLADMQSMLDQLHLEGFAAGASSPMASELQEALDKMRHELNDMNREKEQTLQRFVDLLLLLNEIAEDDQQSVTAAKIVELTPEAFFGTMKCLMREMDVSLEASF